MWRAQASLVVNDVDPMPFGVFDYSIDGDATAHCAVDGVLVHDLS